MNKPLLILTLIASHAACCAQDSPVPPDPQVAPAPPAFQVELTVATSDTTPDAANTTAPAEDKLRKVEITRTGNIQKVVVEYTGSPSQTYWIVGTDVHVDVNSLISSGKSSSMLSRFYAISKHHVGTEWVTSATFKKRMPWKQGEVDFYETEEPAETEKVAAKLSGIDPAQIKSLRRAWIDVTTRAPVAVTIPEGTLAYNFLDTPPAPLQLPEKFVKKQREHDDEIRRQQQEAASR